MLYDDLWKMNYVDSLMIVDKHLNILQSSRFNPRFDDESFESDYSDYISKNFFEVYPSLNQSESSMHECIKSGRVVFRENQIFRDHNGRVFNTQNLTIPIQKKGEIIGAIELSKDITSIDDLEKKISRNVVSRQFADNILSDEQMTFDDIMTLNVDMIENVRIAKILSKSPNPTLIYGETGTGKELFIQSIVNNSNRPRLKFIAQNCAAVPENLIESILFGVVKGAYTGAENKVGLFELADGGVLFLDELNSMPYSTQAKLLRVLQDGKIRPIGSDKEKKVNVKIIAAMNMNPMDAIEARKLREDLFYRFSSSTIKLIPLRERREDILLYVNGFIKIFNNQYSKQIEGLSRTMMDIFMQYEWKGNVRELKHIIESMVSLSEDKILTVKNLPIYMKDQIEFGSEKKKKTQQNQIFDEPILTLQVALEKLEKDMIVKTLIRTKGQMTKTAELLGIPRQTLKYRMDKFQIEKQIYK